MDKDRVAEVLSEIGVLLELKGENPFKSRAYANAARAIQTLEEPIEKLVAENRLGEIKGVGEGLQEKITILVQTGRLPYYEELKASIPAGLVEMLSIPSLGPKKIKALHDRLGISTVEELEAACKAGKVAGLDGFGEKSQAKILEGIEYRRQYASRHLLSAALEVAEPILVELRARNDVTRCDVAGSVRRFKEVIGDVDFIVSSENADAVIECFVTRPGVMSVSAKGSTKASVILSGGIQADIRVVSDREYPFALAYFTGSKEHNIVMRQRAIQRGLRLNEYGLFRSQVETRDPNLCLPCASERDIYEALGLDYIPPELREDKGEFAAAEGHALPRLIELKDIRGSLHNHSNWSDGLNSIAQIASTMSKHGFEYWAITDHSKSSFQANGLDAKRLKQQGEEIKRVNESLAEKGVKFRLLHGTEVDILREGKLDFGDEVLAGLEIVIASLHVPASSEAENTRRLVKAAENPFVHIIGHPTGRLLLEREPYPVNIQAVIDACAETGTWLELNCSPYRLDLDWRLWPQAKSKGVKCAIGPDAHRSEQADWLRLGAGVARKGWLTADDVVNTLDLGSLRKALAAKRSRGKR